MAHVIILVDGYTDLIMVGFTGATSLRTLADEHGVHVPESHQIRQRKKNEKQ